MDNVSSSPDDCRRRRVYTKTVQQVNITLNPSEELVFRDTHLAEAGPTKEHGECCCRFRA